MKLYWSSRSPFVRKVMVFAHECGLASQLKLERTLVAMNNPNRGLLKTNPTGKIPTLELDDGRALYDSTVICEYLDSVQQGQRLFPAAGQARWTALRRHALGNNLTDNLMLWRNELLRPATQQSPETLAAFNLKVRNALDALESEAEALARDPLSIGHIAIAVALSYIDFRFAAMGWRDGHQHLARWYGEYSQRPAMRETAFVDQ
ncbi:MAG: glutathione S-transferase [Burkholderiales bacterium]|nr:glutathione S-transferase [Burkholderiales bacterium]